MNLQDSDYVDQKTLDSKLYRNGLLVVYRRHCSRSDDKTLDLCEQVVVKKKQERSYKVSRTKVQSACVAAWGVKRTKYMLFITFTFPFSISEERASEIWVRMCDLLKSDYAVSSYVWVKERQQSGRLHYHILIDRNRVGIKKLQHTWETIIYNVTQIRHKTHNSVRLGKRPVVYSIHSVKNYLSKYIAKGSDDEKFKKFKTRAFGYTENLKISTDVHPVDARILIATYGGKKIFSDDFIDVYVLNNRFLEEINRYFIDDR